MDQTTAPRGALLLVGALWSTAMGSVAVAGVYVLTVPGAAVAEPDMDVVGWSFFFLIAGALVSVGAVVAGKRRGHPVGWMLLVAGWLLAVSALASAYVEHAVLADRSGRLAAWAAAVEPVLFFPAFVVIGFLLPLVFPDGRLLSRRWRILIGLGLVATALDMLAVILRPGPLPAVPEVMNPMGVAGAGPVVESLERTASVLWPPVVVAVGVAVVLRLVRSDQITRQQFKWVAFPAVVFFVFIALNEVVFPEPTGLAAIVLSAMFVVGFGGLPVGVGVAVLRYRLYDIDRIISRTLAYGVLTVVLVGVYVVGVMGLGAASRTLVGQAPSDGVVAASTLAVAALFGPARRRIQATVDRRFNRASYDARSAVEDLAQRLRDEPDLDALSGTLRETVTSTLQPAHVALWLAPGREAG